MKGIAIILMVVGHWSFLPSWGVKWIYSFHMPLFFILAGYFHKVTSDHRGLALKSARRLLIPYFVTAVIVLVYEVLSAWQNHNLQIMTDHLWAILYASGAHHSSLYGANFPNIGPTWFLFALFWCKLAGNFFLEKKLNYLLIVVIALMATALDYYLIHLPLAILPGLSALTFFVIGYVVKQYGLPLWLALVCVLSWPFAAEFAKAYIGTCTYSFYPLAVSGACGGTLVVYFLSKQMERLSFLSAPMSWMGKNSLTILCFHVIWMNCHLAGKFVPSEKWYVLALAEMAFIIVCTYISSRIPVTRKIFQMS